MRHRRLLKNRRALRILSRTRRPRPDRRKAQRKGKKIPKVTHLKFFSIILSNHSYC